MQLAGDDNVADGSVARPARIVTLARTNSLQAVVQRGPLEGGLDGSCGMEPTCLATVLWDGVHQP